MEIEGEIRIDEGELHEEFVRSTGPGGQNVNKVATAVQLRWDAARSAALPEAVRERLLRLAAAHITGDGVLVINARRYRSQERNRHDARERLADLVRQALRPPKPRHATRPTAASRARRLEGKRRRSDAKRLRRAGTDDA